MTTTETREKISKKARLTENIKVRHLHNTKKEKHAIP